MRNNNYLLKLCCPCKNSKSKVFYKYTIKPKLETKFNLNTQKYIRYYKQCLLCKHLFASHKIDLSNLYSSNYLDATYSGIKGMKKRFNYIMKLPIKKSDNKQRVNRIIHFLKLNLKNNSKKLLDVGAGTGVFAKSLQLKKWDVKTVRQIYGLLNT